MHLERNHGVRGRTALILFLAAAAAVWAALEFSEPRSDWLRVEAPRQAAEGSTFTIRVHLAPQAEPGVLYADLHWGTSRDKPMQYLATGGPKAVGKEGGTFDFRIMVPHRDGLRFVMGVIFWSRTGGWSGHRLAACTRLIPVATEKAATPEGRLEELKLQAPSDLSPDRPRPSAIPRILTALLFLGAVVAAWRVERPANALRGRGERRSPFALGLISYLALACLWELIGLDTWVGAHVRTLARAENLYYPRAIVQKIVTSLAVAAALVLLALLWRMHNPRRLLVAALTAYAAIALVNLVSLHAIDNIAGMSWHGWTVVQMLKLACAALILYGIRSTIKPSGVQPAGSEP